MPCIYLLQMSLDTKRAEIQKLQDRARQREEALKRSEVRLLLTVTANFAVGSYRKTLHSLRQPRCQGAQQPAGSVPKPVSVSLCGLAMPWAGHGQHTTLLVC